MKNGFLSFLREYWLCILLSVIMVIGLSLSTTFADLYESGRGYIRFDLQALYLIFGLPLYSLIYGCFSYMKIKKIWIPQLILYLITCIYFLGTNLIIDKEIDAWKNIFVFSVYPVLFSLIGASITAFIYYIIKSSRGNQN